MRRLLPLLLLAAACSAGPGDGRPVVVAGAYPFVWLAEQVGGDAVSVTDLVKPGAEPHDVELTPRQVGESQEADVVLAVPGFQPALDDAVGDRDNLLDLGEAMDQQGDDPHVWLDPLRMREAATALAERLAAVDPEGAQGYRDRAAGTTRALAELDATMRRQLRGCTRDDVLTGHTAFAYLTGRYALTQRGISGVDPEAEPSPSDVAGAVRFARSSGVTTVFTENLAEPGAAATVADEAGLRVALLDPLEAVRDGDDYLSVQRRNAQALHDALGCRT